MGNQPLGSRWSCHGGPTFDEEVGLNWTRITTLE
jgi:hypothetical protein